MRGALPVGSESRHNDRRARAATQARDLRSGAKGRLRSRLRRNGGQSELTLAATRSRPTRRNNPSTRALNSGARDYEAATGRWLAKDPILFGGGQANLYVYAGNDAVNRVDSTGKIGNYLGWNVLIDSPGFPALGALLGLSVPSGGGVSGGIFYDFNFSTFDFSAGFYRAKTSLVAASKSPLVCGARTEAGVLKSVVAFGGSSAGPAAAIGDWGGSASFDPASPLSVSSLQSLGVSVGVGTGGYIGGFLQDTSLTGFSAGASGIKTF